MQAKRLALAALSNMAFNSLFKSRQFMKPVSNRPSPHGNKVKAASRKVHNLPASNIKMMRQGIVALALSTLTFIGVAGIFAAKASSANALNQSEQQKIKQLSSPVYDEQYDFLTDQCDKTAYCIATETTNPSLELLKFLVTFREKPGQQYRLFFEVSAGKTAAAQPYELSCDTQDAKFYSCLEISSPTPTDVLRVFQKSYESLAFQSTYTINLMVKPIAEIVALQKQIPSAPTAVVPTASAAAGEVAPTAALPVAPPDVPLASSQSDADAVAAPAVVPLAPPQAAPVATAAPVPTTPDQ